MINVFLIGTPDREHLTDFALALGFHGAPSPNDPRFDSVIRSNFALVPTVETAQAVVFAQSFWKSSIEAEQAMALAKSRRIPCVFSSYGDDATPPPVPSTDAYVVRHSIDARLRLPHELAMPAFFPDPLPNGNISPRTKSKEPSVGFVGFVGSALQRGIYRLAMRNRKADSLAFRARILTQLRRASGVHCEFQPQTAFRGAGKKASEAQKLAARQNFLSNVNNTDYTLCMRGAGNFSYRFYETLALGRIPLLVNTHCVLPFEEPIPWKQHVCWVEESDIPDIGAKLRAFHESLSPAQFVELQHSNRALWENWLQRPEWYLRFFESLLGKPK